VRSAPAFSRKSLPVPGPHFLQYAPLLPIGVRQAGVSRREPGKAGVDLQAATGQRAESSGVDPNSPQFQAAQKACQSYQKLGPHIGIGQGPGGGPGPGGGQGSVSSG